MKAYTYTLLLLACFSYSGIQGQYYFDEGQLDPDFYAIDQVIYGSLAPYDSIAVISPDTSLPLADRDFQASLHFSGAWLDTAYVHFTNTGEQYYYSSDFSNPDTLYIFKDQSGSPAGNEYFKIFNDSVQGALILNIRYGILNNPFGYRWTQLYFNGFNQVEKIEVNSIGATYTHFFYYSGSSQRPDSSYINNGFDEFRFLYYNTNGITDSVRTTHFSAPTWKTYLNHNVAGEVTSILSKGYHYNRLTKYIARPSAISTPDWQMKNDNLLYPNPVDRVLLLPSLTGETPYEIMDLNGRVLRKGVSSESINVHVLSPGQYYLRMNGHNQLFIKR